jgi:hypothetical protein
MPMTPSKLGGSGSGARLRVMVWVDSSVKEGFVSNPTSQQHGKPQELQDGIQAFSEFEEMMHRREFALVCRRTPTKTSPNAERPVSV